MKINQKELFIRMKKDLEKIVDDNLVTICKTKSNKIIACFAGFKFSNIKMENIKSNEFIKYYKLSNIMSQEEKYNILIHIDYHLMKDNYEFRKQNKELEISIFCDFYCISEDYFQSRNNLNVELIYYFFLNCKQKGIKYTYGLFFNPKAIKLVMNYLNFEVLNDVNIILENENQKKKFRILALHGKIDKIDFENFSKPNL